MRGGDRGFRWGGDEFALLLPDTDHEGAEQAAARLASEILNTCSDAEGRPLSVSWGAAEATEGMTTEELLTQADLALMGQKRERLQLEGQETASGATGPPERRTRLRADRDRRHPSRACPCVYPHTAPQRTCGKLDEVDQEQNAMPSGIPPGPSYPSWIQSIGFWTRPLAFLERCRARYGKRFTIRLPLAPPFVMISDPEEVKQVFTAPPDVLHPGEGAQVLAARRRNELGHPAGRGPAPGTAQADASRLPRREDGAPQRPDRGGGRAGGGELASRRADRAAGLACSA